MSESSAEDMILLVQYLNGELSEGSAAAVRERLKSDLDLRATLLLIEAIRDADRAESVHFEPSPFGWNRLKKVISRESNWNGWHRQRVPSWQAAAAAIVVGVAGWQLGAFSSESGIVSDSAGYSLAGGNEGADHGIKVAFMPDAPHSAVGALLRSVDGQIVSGPSALGFYTVEFDSAEGHDNALRKFANEKLVVADFYSDR